VPDNLKAAVISAAFGGVDDPEATQNCLHAAFRKTSISTATARRGSLGCHRRLTS
jgi:hypothetical protein